MQDFTGKIAVVTGGGSGIGRALVRRLAQDGCHVATCDIRAETLAETRTLALGAAPPGVTVTTFVADVADEAQVTAFCKDTLTRHDSDHVHLVFGNAGVGGGGSFVTDSRQVWERTFNVCWGGVYNTARAFMPALIRAPKGRLVNVSSVNGFWASLGPTTTHTAYSAAKFAVKGFTEALIVDLRLNAPHVEVSLVMPGHIGTSIYENSIAEFAPDMDAPDLAEAMARAEAFRNAGLTPEQAADVILDGVREGRWRILVGPDAFALDAIVRAEPERAYDLDFFDRVAAESGRRAERA